MRSIYATLLGKSIKKLAQLRGGGSALPGLFVEKIDKDFVSRTLAQLPDGVVIVSGTNGKTTTTKMVVELLEGQGLRVFTNRTGSNFVRGVAAALLGEVDLRGNLHADIAVLELDEAHAVHFVKTVNPRYSLLLNVMRDQLDRFGEIDTTARMLAAVADATTESIVLNREDPRIAALATNLDKKTVRYFGLSDNLRHQFPNDDDMRATSRAPKVSLKKASVTLETIRGQTATFNLNGTPHTLDLKLKGVYNVYNAAAAIALVLEVRGDELNVNKLLADLSEVTPAFGRGEQIIVNGQSIDLVLVKNPAGFRLSLESFPPEEYTTMIAINDNYADGRDMSWLWDVEFESLKEHGVAIVSGIRAYDMALRLQYDEIAVGSVEVSLAKALKQTRELYPDKSIRIYCTYTAMLKLRREIAKLTKVEVVS